MWATLVVLIALTVAAITDLRQSRIYNWTTYPAIVLGLVAQFADRDLEGLWDGLAGLFVCGGLLLFLFLFGGTGGGDLKLIAAMGAGLGLYDGIETMLWTFVIAAVVASAVVIWQVGAIKLLRQFFNQVWWVFRLRGWIPLTADERQPLKQTLFLAPSAWIALLVVRQEELHSLWKLLTGSGSLPAG